jgi:hypothetical protein
MGQKENGAVIITNKALKALSEIRSRTNLSETAFSIQIKNGQIRKH